MIGTSAMRKATFQAIQHGERGILFLLGRNKQQLKSSARVEGLICPRETRWISSGQNASNESSANSASEEYDIIIAGGGLVGTALACSLGKEAVLQQHKILVLEAAPKMDPMNLAPEKYSNRVSSITPGTKQLLEEIGAWDGIRKLRYKGYSKMHVWDACGAGYITFNANEVVKPDENETEVNMAFIIENSVILSAMAQRMQELRSNVHVRYSSRIKDIQFPNEKNGDGFKDLVNVSLENGEDYKAKLLIGADGINSVVRNKAKMRYLKHDYQQTAVVATLHLEKDIPNHIAWQRFLPSGPIAMLPLSRNRSSLVWSTTPADAKSLVEVPEEEFIDSVNNAFMADCDRHPLIDQSGSIVQSIISAVQPGSFAGSQLEQPPSVCGIDSASRATYPLGLGHASHYVNNRVALIGDAAHRVHPLAGQGVNLGASDVTCLTEILVDAVEHGEDIGDLDHLLHYETCRQREVIPMMTAIDTLKRLFSTSFFPFVFARTVGLQATNALTPLKEEIIKHAMK